jgi:hypothetical protein
LYSAAAFVAALAAFQAAMVLTINSPKNAIHSSLDPLLRRYDGPWIEQNWSLFAPEIMPKNLRVLVRAKMTNGTTTAWYDASLYFMDAMEANRLTPLRPISEGLFHSATIAVDHNSLTRDPQVEVTLIRTSAMVFKRYVTQRPRSIQIEIDGRDITVGGKAKDGPPQRYVRSAWEPFPMVEPI